jgi:hypothetical protein
LAIVNSTFRKTQGSRLPGIVEEMRKSGDSTTSTVDNETWAMESLETEVFDNVRASIQRSLGKPNKVPGGLAGSSKPLKATSNVPRIAGNKPPMSIQCANCHQLIATDEIFYPFQLEKGLIGYLRLRYANPLHHT